MRHAWISPQLSAQEKSMLLRGDLSFRSSLRSNCAESVVSEEYIGFSQSFNHKKSRVSGFSQKKTNLLFKIFFHLLKEALIILTRLRLKIRRLPQFL
jgi:hypothetical protein